MVDTSYFLDDLRRDLEELRSITNRKVGYVVNTHYHSDHAYGNSLFGCPIIAHRECPRLMKLVRKRAIQEILQQETDPTVKEHVRRLRLRYPNILFENSYRINSHPAIDIIHVGGHTPDLSIVYVPEERIMFASDNLFGTDDPSVHSHPYIAMRSDVEEWISALERMRKMNAKVIVPGHFGTCNMRAVSRMIEYLKLFTRNLKELKRQGLEKEELKRHPELLKLPALPLQRWLPTNIEYQYGKL